MTTRNLAVRLAVIDGGKVKAELREVGESGQRSLRRIETAARPATQALRAIDGAAGQVRGSLEGLAGRLGPLGGMLRALGPAGIAAGAAIAGLGLVLARGVQEAAEAERSYRRLEAVLRVTGHASGLTVREIAGFAEEMERTTLASAEAVQDAAAILATFRSVAGETFTRAIRLAQDLSAVFGQDLRSSATQLGKALEEPVQGISALRRVGVSFTASQRALIASLVETGQTAAAQRVILDALERQVGGAAAAETGGVTGAANRLSDAWGNLLKALGRTPAVSGLAEGALDALARAVERITSLFEDDPISVRIVAANRRLIEAEDRLARLRESGNRRAIVVTERLVADLRRQVDALIAQARRETEAYEAERRRAEEGRRRAEAERRAELIATRRRELDRAIERLATAPAERIARINRELAETRRRLEALRAPDGGNAAEVDAAIARAEELARRRIEAVERPAREAAARLGAANTRVIEDLRRQITGLADERRGFIEQALARLSEGATAAQRAEVERLAGALYDEKQAREALAKAQREDQRLREEGRQLVERLRTPTEAYAAAIERLNTLLRIGAIDQETFGRAAAEAYDRMLRGSREWSAGVRRAIRDHLDEAGDAARRFEQATTRALKASEDAFVQWATTGKLSATDLFNTIAEEALRTAWRMAVLRPLSGLFEQLLGMIGSSLFDGTSAPGPVGDFPPPEPVQLAHGGGVIGDDRLAERLVSPALFAGAARFHRGGVVGSLSGLRLSSPLGGSEVPIVAARGETVFTPGQMRLLGERLAARPEVKVAVNVRNMAPGAEASADWRRDANGDLSLDIVIQQVEGRIARNIGRGDGLAPTLERRYGLNPAAGSFR
ncbi:phage tail tape measure C-terminal domain-containing protein [Albidovulum sp.]